MLETPRIEREHMEAWLSAPRYGKYLETASGDDALAFELYLWNIGLAQAASWLGARLMFHRGCRLVADARGTTVCQSINYPATMSASAKSVKAC